MLVVSQVKRADSTFESKVDDGPATQYWPDAFKDINAPIDKEIKLSVKFFMKKMLGAKTR